MEETLKKLTEDPSFQEAFSKTASAEEASALLAQHGIQITPEELSAALAQPEGELSENELDEVAGGCWCPWCRFVCALAKWISEQLRKAQEAARNW